jgi:asparagine synthase (glutamine-hydrolysing)
MCGILAYLGPTRLDEGHRAIEAVAHRGPDDSGAVSFAVGDNFLSLGHRRLSILDLSAAGRQPMSWGEGRWWIVYNGEIYNFIELRQELEAAGVRFLTGTDTELLLAAYARWGEDCLPRLNGMFALALFDGERRELFVARDRFGIKPLYVWNEPRGFAVCSEPKQLCGLPGFRPELNAKAAYEFLAWGDLDHSPETMFQGVAQLHGGETFTLSLGRWRPGGDLSLRRWYDLAAAVPPGSPRIDGAAGLRDLLGSSVGLRLRADVPVGFCLSGGLDSSSLVCLADRLAGTDGAGRHAFSACFEDEAFDERPYVEAVRAKTGVTSHLTLPRPQGLMERLPEIVYHHDEPFGTASLYAQWHVFGLAREHRVPVTLDGQGADEVLAGYDSFYGSYLSSLLLRGRWRRLWREARALGADGGRSPSVLAKMILACLLPLHHGPSWSWPREGRRAHGLLDPDWRRRVGLRWRGPHPMRRQRSLRRMTIARIESTLPALLHHADRMSMAHSIEARVPFLDHRVVELALGLADEEKLGHGWTKGVLREAMEGVLPEKVRRRTDKLTFQPPEADWVRHHVAEEFRQLLDRAAARPLFNRGETLRRYDDFVAGRGPYERVFWRMVTFGLWADIFLQGGGARP